jgi:hypothetical protein
MSKGKKVSICIPSRGEMAIGTAFDLAIMVGYDSKYRKGQNGVYTVNGTLIFDQRNNLAQAALEEESDYILWIDADMRFPKNTIERLLKHDKDIVGVNATTRTIPVKATAKMLEVDAENKENRWLQVLSKGKTGLQRVTSIGCGVMLVKRRVFEQTPKPWFWFYQIPGGKTLGEDVHFCVAASDAGFETWVDHDLSQEIGHVGEYTYGWKDILLDDNQLQRPKNNGS